MDKNKVLLTVRKRKCGNYQIVVDIIKNMESA